MDKVGVLKVETIVRSDGNNPFYGNRRIRTTLREETSFEKFEGVEPAPCGFYGFVKLEDYRNATMVIMATEYRLDHKDENLWTDIFTIGSNVFELSVWYNEKGEIDHAMLEQWLNQGDFEDGCDADYIYNQENGFEALKLLDLP